MLCGKKWFCTGITEIRRGIQYNPAYYNRKIEFGCDGKYDHEGNWTVVSDRFIKITLTRNPNVNWLLNGAYSIYSLSDSSLVLGQILTSSGDWTKEYMFTTSVPSGSTHSFFFQKEDIAKDGEQIKHYPDGGVMSIENHTLIKRKLSAEELFLGYFEIFGDRFNPLDSTIVEPIPQGEWLYYHSNGTLSARYQYNNEGKRVGTWVFYDSRGRLIETRTYDEYDRTEYIDHYEYPKSASLAVIKRSSPGQKNGRFVIGSTDSVEFSSIDFYVVQSLNSNAVRDIKVKNLSNHEVSLSIRRNSHFKIEPIQATIESGDSTVLRFEMKIPGGPGDDFIHMESSEWKLDMKVKYLGYHLSNADFDSDSVRILPRKIFFHRLSDDHELQITTSGNKKILPISKQVSEIDLKKGKYQLTLIGRSGRKTINVEVR